MKCKICDFEEKDPKKFSTHIFSKHKLSSLNYTIKFLYDGFRPLCPECKKETRYVAFEFKEYCKQHGKIKMSIAVKMGGSAPSWNRGKTKNTDERIMRQAIEMAGEKISIEADTEERAKATLDVVKDKMIKRGVSLKHIDPAEPQLSGKIYKISCPLKEGISTENAKKIAKFLRDEGPKSVKSQIQGDELRVTSKSRDDLQATMAMIKEGKWDFAVQFVNFR
jgi:uncharacterized protein YajQ (UPF0234 family)